MTEKGEKLLEKMRENQATNQADFFDVNILTFTDEVRQMCVQNTCGRYGRSWNCPPVCGTVEELEAACKHYSNGILVNTVSQLKDSFDWEGMQAGGRALSDMMTDFNLASKDVGMTDYRVFSGGSCHTCKDCGYPDTPCRHPDALFTPIEACGINVMQTALDAGFKYINGQNTVTFFGMVLFND